MCRLPKGGGGSVQETTTTEGKTAMSENEQTTVDRAEAVAAAVEAANAAAKQPPDVFTPPNRRDAYFVDRDPPAIHAAMAAIMAEIEAVGKTRDNVQQRYKFRGIADVYQAAQRLFAKHGVHVVPTVTERTESEHETRNGGRQFRVVIRVRFTAYAADGSFVDGSTIGEAMDSGDKAYNKAMSSAMKYWLIQTCLLPEEDPDVDTETKSPELASKQPATPPPPRQKATAAQLQRLSSAIASVIPSDWVKPPDDATPEQADTLRKLARLRWVNEHLEDRTVKTLRELFADEVEGMIEVAAQAGEVSP